MIAIFVVFVRKAFNSLDEDNEGFTGSALERNFNILEQAKETLEMPNEILEKPLVRPQKEDLDALKEVMNIERGCLQYKKRGDGVYLVKYDSEKKGYVWTLLGRWVDLRRLIYL